MRKGAIFAEKKALHLIRRAGPQKLRPKHDNGRLPKRHCDFGDFRQDGRVRGRLHEGRANAGARFAGEVAGRRAASDRGFENGHGQLGPKEVQLDQIRNRALDQTKLQFRRHSVRADRRLERPEYQLQDESERLQLVRRQVPL